MKEQRLIRRKFAQEVDCHEIDDKMSLMSTITYLSPADLTQFFYAIL